MATTRTVARTMVALTALVASACGGGGSATVERTATAGGTASTDATAPPVATAPTDAVTTTAPPGSDAPAGATPDALDFSAPAVTGGQVVGAEFVGEAVALWFWAPW